MRAFFSISATLIVMATATIVAPTSAQNPAAPPLNAKVQETLIGAYGGLM